MIEHECLQEHEPKEKQQPFQEINIHPFTFILLYYLSAFVFNES